MGKRPINFRNFQGLGDGRKGRGRNLGTASVASETAGASSKDFVGIEAPWKRNMGRIVKVEDPQL